MGAAGLVICFVLPIVIASWIRALRARRQASGAAGGGPATPARTAQKPSSLMTIAVSNALLLAVCALAAPKATQRALHQHGAWWVARIARAVGGDEQNAVVRVGHGAVRWLADLLPGPAPTPSPGTASGTASGTAPRLDSAVARLPDARRADQAPPPDPGGEVRVVYEKRGNAIIVPVTVQGAGGSTAVKMIFDTGASLTTINEATLRAVGQWVATDDPTVETHTANGVVQRRITAIEGVGLGAARVGGGVTVSVCEPCASGDVVGLLGLNVQRHFRVTLDHDAGKLVLAPKSPPVGHLQDIMPFVEMRDASGEWRGPLLQVSLALVNRASRGLRNVRVAAVIKGEGKEGRIWGEAKVVPAKDRTPLKLEGLSPVKGKTFQLVLERAEW
jgi:predicted aspartyl protease